MKLKNKPITTELVRITMEFQDKFPKFPKDQKVNFCNCSAELKYESTPTKALVKLPNIFTPILKGNNLFHYACIKGNKNVVMFFVLCGMCFRIDEKVGSIMIHSKDENVPKR